MPSGSGKPTARPLRSESILIFKRRAASVSALAMPLIGGTAHWIGPVLGALLLGSVQQIVTVTISSELNVLVVGVLLVVFVVAAPEGIVGLYRRILGRKG